MYVKSVEKRTERKDYLRRGGKSEAGSGSIWLPRWSDLLNHLVTGSIPYTYGHHENNKGFFLPRDALSLLLTYVYSINRPRFRSPLQHTHTHTHLLVPSLTVIIYIFLRKFFFYHLQARIWKTRAKTHKLVFVMLNLRLRHCGATALCGATGCES